MLIKRVFMKWLSLVLIMRNRFGIALLLCFLSLALLFSCSPSTEEDSGEGTLSVFVNIPPQAWMVEQIAGDAVEVEVILPPGSEPHVFSPTPKQIMRLGKADFYFHGALPFEQRIAGRIKSAQAVVKVVDITQGVHWREIGEQHENSHDHAHNNDHQNEDSPAHGEGKDPHVWLSVHEIKVMAENIKQAFIEADPKRKEFYRDNYHDLIGEVEDVHTDLKRMLAPYEGRTFYVFHPAFGYFARDYGLRQEAVEIGGRSPTPRQLRELITQAKEEEVRVIFVQPQFDSSSAEVVAEAIGGVAVPLDPLSEDVLANLMEIGERIEEGFGDTEE